MSSREPEDQKPVPLSFKPNTAVAIALRFLALNPGELRLRGRSYHVEQGSQFLVRKFHRRLCSHTSSDLASVLVTFLLL